MKKFLTILCIVFLTSIPYLQSQELVSTEPQLRNVVLEEMTGIYCGFCPDGHRLAQQLASNNPGRVVLINVHAGSYANPQAGSGHPDFRTPYGDALVTLSNLAGFPAGMVNRQLFDGSQYQPQKPGALALSRGGWAYAGADVIAGNSPVNIGAKIERTSLTTLEITVELYYTEGTGQNSKLNIALLEDGYVGYQGGSTEGNNYIHNHILRDFVTGQWGDIITQTTKGSLVTKTYTYELTNRVDPIKSNLKMAFYVTQADNKFVFTGIEADVPKIKPNAEFLATGEKMIAVKKNNTFTKSATVKNISETPITFEISALAQPKANCNWTAELVNAEVSTLTLQPNEIADISYKITTDNNPGKISAFLNVKETNTELMLSYSDDVTCISSDAEFYLVTDKSEEVYDVENYIVKAGYDKFLNIYPTEFKIVKEELDQVKTLVWNSGAVSFPTADEANSISTLMGNNVKVLMMGNRVISYLDAYSSLGYFGSSYIGYSTQGYGSSPWRVWLSGIEGDPITGNLGLMIEGNLISYLLNLVKIVDHNTTSPILHFANDGRMCKWNAQTSKTDTFDITGPEAIFGVKVDKGVTKHVLLGLSPYVIRDITLREKLIKASLDWMHGVVGVEEDFQTIENALNAFPNPFYQTTSVKYYLSNQTDVHISFFDIYGSKVYSEFLGNKAPGEHSYNWNASQMPQGVYNAVINAGNNSSSIKVVLLK